MRLLDLCCGHGLASWGYWLSGAFSEIVGVDNEDMSSSYSFDFIQRDALTMTYDDLLDFDYIHASPPCQFYSKATPPAARVNHWRSIPPIRLILEAAGKPYTIENVEGSGHDLHPTIRLRGYELGLPIDRVRYFRCSWMSIDHRLEPGSHVPASDVEEVHGDYKSKRELEALFGLECIPAASRRKITRKGILQGIPPAMTLFLARDFMSTRSMSNVAHPANATHKVPGSHRQLLIQKSMW